MEDNNIYALFSIDIEDSKSAEKINNFLNKKNLTGKNVTSYMDLDEFDDFRWYIVSDRPLLTKQFKKELDSILNGNNNDVFFGSLNSEYLNK